MQTRGFYKIKKLFLFVYIQRGGSQFFLLQFGEGHNFWAYFYEDLVALPPW